MARQHSCPTLAARQWKLQAVCLQQGIINKLEVRNQLEIVDTIHYPADLGSRGCNVESLADEWWDGSSWLANYEEWPKQEEIIPTTEFEKEAKLIREVTCVTAEQQEEFNEILHKYHF